MKLILLLKFVLSSLSVTPFSFEKDGLLVNYHLYLHLLSTFVQVIFLLMSLLAS